MRVTVVLILCIIFAFTLIVKSQVSYSRYSLIRVTPVTELQLQSLLIINGNSSIGIDFWLRTTAVNKSADVMIAPRAKCFFLSSLDELNIPYKFLAEDLGKLIEDDRPETSNPPANPDLKFFLQYKRYAEFLRFIVVLAGTYPELVTPLEIGRSYENRPLMLLKISTPGSENKPAIWIQGGAHAREHIGCASVAYFALQLVTGYNQEPDIKTIVDAFDWYLLPVLNPDGYEYSHTTDRLWRKTRSINPSNPECIGVDANRNWDLAWSDAAGSSRDPCSHNYAGTQAFSESETRSISNFMMKELKQRLLLFLDMHSYSQRWLSPWGYKTALPSNFQNQKELAEVATNALERLYGTKYSVGTSAGSLYTVSGGARDWVYGVMGAEYSYVVELRDNGNYGFLLNRAQILPTVMETWAGVLAMAKELLTRQQQFIEDLKNSTKDYIY